MPVKSRMKDKIQITVATLLIVAGIASFYWLGDRPTIARIGVMLGCFLIAGIVGWFTQPGRDFVSFARESVEEAKKVVWPSRKETLQSTTMIFVFVFVMAVFLWIVDWSLTFVLTKFLGHGA